MIETLRKRFIMTSMTLVSIVLFSVIIALLISVYHQQKKTDEQTLKWAITQKELSSSFEIGQKHEDMKPSDSSTFCIELNEYGDIKSIICDDGILVSTSVLAELRDYVIERGNDEGLIRKYGVRYLVKESIDGMTVAFVDVSDNASAFDNMLRASFVATVLSLLVLYSLCVYLADKAIKPVKESWDRQKRFVADASHELKTPLTVVLANTDIVLSNSDQTVESQRKWIENTKTEAKRMNRLVNDMLFLAKSDMAKETAFIFSDVDFSEIVSECVLTFEPLAYENKIKIESIISDEIILNGDPSKLKEMVNILLDNAIKYSSRNTTIYLNLEHNNSNIILSVKNTGIVIPADKQAGIFERFYRSDDSRARDTGGYGLGLAIAKNIALSHRGKLTLDYSSEEQTCFSVSIPFDSKTQRSLKA